MVSCIGGDDALSRRILQNTPLKPPAPGKATGHHEAFSSDLRALPNSTRSGHEAIRNGSA